MAFSWGVLVYIKMPYRCSPSGSWSTDPAVLVPCSHLVSCGQWDCQVFCYYTAKYLMRSDWHGNRNKRNVYSTAKKNLSEKRYLLDYNQKAWVVERLFALAAGSLGESYQNVREFWNIIPIFNRPPFKSTLIKSSPRVIRGGTGLPQSPACRLQQLSYFNFRRVSQV